MTRVAADKSSGKSPRQPADAILSAAHVHKAFQMGDSTVHVLQAPSGG